MTISFCGTRKKFFNEKLKIAPIGGGFIVTDWNKIKDNYAIVYMPEIAYKATDNAEIALSASNFYTAKETICLGNLMTMICLFLS